VTAYDAIVIGTGHAGPSVTSRLAGAGMSVAVIERNALGGTCANRHRTGDDVRRCRQCGSRSPRRGVEYHLRCRGTRALA